jgi:hypothetical protein
MTGVDLMTLRSLATFAGMAIVSSALPLIASPSITRAATIEEVARCRAMQINRERWDCFKALKSPRRNTAKAKRDDRSPSQGEAAPAPKPEDIPPTKSEDAPTKGDVSNTKTEDVPIPKSEDASPAASQEAREPASDDPVSTSSIDHSSVLSGQIVCADQDSLLAAFVAGVALGTDSSRLVRYGCQTIPTDAQVEVLQRFPSSFPFVRLVKVNVTFAAQPNSRVGYTFEISR